MSPGLAQGIGGIVLGILAIWILAVIYCGIAGVFPQMFPGGGGVVCEVIMP